MDELTRDGLPVVFTLADLPELNNDRDRLRCRLASVATTEQMAKNMVSAGIGRHNYEATLKPTKSNPDKITCQVSTLDGNESDIFLALNHKRRKICQPRNPGQQAAADRHAAPAGRRRSSVFHLLANVFWYSRFECAFELL